MKRVPARTFVVKVSDKVVWPVELRGDAGAAMAYNELTDGKGLEDAFNELKPSLRRHEDGEKLPPLKPHDKRTYLDLMWAFSATWREEAGWDDEEEEAVAAVSLPPRKRPSFRKLKKNLNMADLRKLRQVVLPLMFETLLPPGEAVPSELLRDQERLLEGSDSESSLSSSQSEPIGT